MSTQETIRVADILEDIYKLPFVGYSVDVKHNEQDNILTANVVMSDGGEPETIMTVHECDVEVKAVADAQRRLSLISAMLTFLNTGGAPEDIADIAGQMQCLSAVQLRNFELLDIHETQTLDLFLIDSADQIVRVVPGLWSEPITHEEYHKLHDEFYAAEDEDDE